MGQRKRRKLHWRGGYQTLHHTLYNILLYYAILPGGVKVAIRGFFPKWRQYTAAPISQSRKLCKRSLALKDGFFLIVNNKPNGF